MATNPDHLYKMPRMHKAFAVSSLAFGMGAVSVTIAVVATAAFSLAFYRPSRGLFFALDYLIDSADDYVRIHKRIANILAKIKSNTKQKPGHQ